MKNPILSRCLFICLFVNLFAYSTLYAKTHVIFSPEGSIKETIIENINLSEKSIDVAVHMFTDGEIAEALYNAKERGVKIKIVIDQRQEKKRYPVLEFLKEEDFDLQFLKGNIGGFMNHSFAIFDAKQLVTGSYNWTEYAEKFNYENAIFIDDSVVIKRFQEEFETLYEKSRVSRINKLEETGPYGPHSKVEAITELNKEKVLNPLDNAQIEKEKEPNPKDSIATSVTKTKDIPTEALIQKEQTRSTIKLPGDFLDISFDEFNNIFGEKSNLKNAEKKQLWKNEFKGKYISWTGTILFKGVAIYDWNRVMVDHEDTDIDVQLRFDWRKRRKVTMLSVGDVINYIGRLDSLQGFSSSYKVVNADVLN